MAGLKPAYLVHGDDDAKIDAWRGRLRRRAEDERGPGGLEIFDARSSPPEEVATALASLSLDPGIRYVLVDDVGAWKANQLAPVERAIADLPEALVLVLIARGKTIKALQKAVEKAGGEVRECAAPKPWEMPKWCIERAGELSLTLDSRAAKDLVALVGTGQQRLSRELEKLAIALHPATTATAEDVERLSSGDASPQAYELADALVAGDLKACMTIAEEIEAHGERPARAVYRITARLREVHRAVALIESGVPEQRVAGAIGGPPWLAKKTIARARKADRAGLERAMCVFADLEVNTRGGGELPLDEDTAFSLALARAAD